MGFFTAAAIGLSLYSGISGARSQRAEAKRQIGFLNSQISLLNKSREQINEAYGAKAEIISDVFGNRSSSLVNRMANELGKVTESADSQRARSGLVSSGTVDRRETISSSFASRQFLQQNRSLLYDMENKLIENSLQQQSELSSTETRLENLRGQVELYKQQKKKRYLGIF